MEFRITGPAIGEEVLGSLIALVKRGGYIGKCEVGEVEAILYLKIMFDHYDVDQQPIYHITE